MPGTEHILLGLVALNAIHNDNKESKLDARASEKKAKEDQEAIHSQNKHNFKKIFATPVKHQANHHTKDIRHGNAPSLKRR